MKKEILIPFCGFYNSAASAEVDNEIDMMFDYEGSGDVQTPDDFFDHVNFSDVYTEVAKGYVEAFEDYFKNEYDIDLQLSFKTLDSPKYYNFATDRIFAEIPMEVIKELFEKVNETVLRQVIKDNFTSYDGFMSFYSNNLDEWSELEEWDHNQLSMLLYAMGDPEYWDIMEDFRGNGGYDEALFSGMDETAVQMYDEYMKKFETCS